MTYVLSYGFAIIGKRPVLVFVLFSAYFSLFLCAKQTRNDPKFALSFIEFQWQRVNFNPTFAVYVKLHLAYSPSDKPLGLSEEDYHCNSLSSPLQLPTYKLSYETHRGRSPNI